MWFSEKGKGDVKNNANSSHIEFTTHKEIEVNFRMNNNLTCETYAYLNPEFDQVDGLVERAVDDCTKDFHRFKHKRVFVIKYFHQTHETTSHFT